jgi:glycine oxidase
MTTPETHATRETRATPETSAAQTASPVAARARAQRGPAPDFAVLGGGLCGRLVAWRLAGAGYRVALYERGDASGTQSAAWVAAAMLAPLAEAASAELLITRLGAASLDIWPRIVAELPEPVFFQRNGTLVVWHHSDRSEAPLFERRLRANAPAELLEGGLLALSGAQINAAEPALAGRFTQGWLLPHEGQLDNRQVLAALAAGLAERGVETHWNTAIDDRELPPARITIDCRGLGAKPVLPTLRGIRGEVARVHAPGIGLARPVRLLHPRYPLYIAPKQNDLYVIGATEVEGEDMSPVSVRSALELLSAAFSVHPGFGEARILELNSQCRPTLPDHRPAIVWNGGETLRVNGLYRHGYMIAPEVADEAVRFALALADGAIADVDAFADWRRQTQWSELFHVDHPKSRDAVRESA